MTTIHESAIVDAKAVLGADVTVGPYSIIGPDVQLGDRVVVGPHVVIEGHTTIGAESRIFQFASVGSAPQDLKYHGEPSTLEIGARNIIREYTTLQPGTEGGGMRTVIGDGNLFMVSAHVGHDCQIGSRNIFANCVALAGHVTIMNNTVIGGLCAVHQFVRVGDFAMMSGGSMVSQDVPPFCVVQGDRAQIRGVNTIGLERGGVDKEQISLVKRAYRHLFSTSGGLASKIDEMEPELLSSPLVQSLVTFVKTSERGICAPAKNL